MAPERLKTGGSTVTVWQSWKSYRELEKWTVELPKGGDLPWALFYPADYSIGSSNLGIQYIFRLLREDGVAAERFFSSPVPYRSVDYDTLLERFPVITAGVSFEGDAETFFSWLSGAGIPLLPSDRVRNNYPVIGAGGALTYINPLLLSGVCDFIVLGDGTAALPCLTSAIRRYLSDGERTLLWERLAEHANILVPPLHFTDGRLNTSRTTDISQPLDERYPMLSTWVTPKSTFGDTLLIELQRGCARKCRYCTLPGCFGKLRQRKFACLKDTLADALDRVPCEQIGLVTPEAGDYSDMDALLDFIGSRGRGVSFASLRVDGLTEKMVEALGRGGRKSLTIAPEAAREELRLSCGKRFTNDLIMQKLMMAKEYGIEQVKLYFMVGLPGETDEDIAGIAEMCGDIIKETGQNLIVSAGAFIPKPGTEWALERFIGVREIKRKYGLLEKGLRALKKKKPQLRLSSPRESEREYILTWSGYNESVALAKGTEQGLKPIFKDSNAAKILLELERLR